jgi:hypothetical protein
VAKIAPTRVHNGAASATKRRDWLCRAGCGNGNTTLRQQDLKSGYFGWCSSTAYERKTSFVSTSSMACSISWLCSVSVAILGTPWNTISMGNRLRRRRVLLEKRRWPGFFGNQSGRPRRFREHLRLALIALLRPHYARVDQEGRTLLHELFVTAGDIRVSDSELHITLAPLSSPHRTHAAQALCEMLDQTATIFPGSRLRIRFAVRPRPRIRLAFPGSPVERGTASAVAPVP